MSKKRVKSGASKAGAAASSEGSSPATPLSDTLWSVHSVLLHTPLPYSTKYTNSAVENIRRGYRRRFSVITKDELVNAVRDAAKAGGGAKGGRRDSNGTASSFQDALLQAAPSLDGNELPMDVAARLVRARLQELRVRDLERKAAASTAPDNDGQDAGDASLAPSSSRPGTGRQSPSKTPSKSRRASEKAQTPSAKRRSSKGRPPSAASGGSSQASTMAGKRKVTLKTRAEEEAEIDYIDDEPQDGPDAYCLLVGLDDPLFLQTLADCGACVSTVCTVTTVDDDDDGSQADSDLTSPSRSKGRRSPATARSSAATDRSPSPRSSSARPNSRQQPSRSAARSASKQDRSPRQAKEKDKEAGHTSSEHADNVDTMAGDQRQLSFVEAARKLCADCPSGFPLRDILWRTAEVGPAPTPEAVFDAFAKTAYEAVTAIDAFKQYQARLAFVAMPGQGTGRPSGLSDIAEEGDMASGSDSAASHPARLVQDTSLYRSLLDTVPQEAISVPIVMDCMLQQLSHSLDKEQVVLESDGNAESETDVSSGSQEQRSKSAALDKTASAGEQVAVESHVKLRQMLQLGKQGLLFDLEQAHATLPSETDEELVIRYGDSLTEQLRWHKPPAGGYNPLLGGRAVLAQSRAAQLVNLLPKSPWLSQAERKAHLHAIEHFSPFQSSELTRYLLLVEFEALLAEASGLPVKAVDLEEWCQTEELSPECFQQLVTDALVSEQWSLTTRYHADFHCLLMALHRPRADRRPEFSHSWSVISHTRLGLTNYDEHVAARLARGNKYKFEGHAAKNEDNTLTLAYDVGDSLRIVEGSSTMLTPVGGGVVHVTEDGLLNDTRVKHWTIIKDGITLSRHHSDRVKPYLYVSMRDSCSVCVSSDIIEEIQTRGRRKYEAMVADLKRQYDEELSRVQQQQAEQAASASDKKGGKERPKSRKNVKIQDKEKEEQAAKEATQVAPFTPPEFQPSEPSDLFEVTFTTPSGVVVALRPDQCIVLDAPRDTGEDTKIRSKRVIRPDGTVIVLHGDNHASVMLANGSMCELQTDGSWSITDWCGRTLRLPSVPAASTAGSEAAPFSGGSPVYRTTYDLQSRVTMQQQGVTFVEEPAETRCQFPDGTRITCRFDTLATAQRRPLNIIAGSEEEAVGADQADSEQLPRVSQTSVGGVSASSTGSSKDKEDGSAKSNNGTVDETQGGESQDAKASANGADTKRNSTEEDAVERSPHDAEGTPKESVAEVDAVRDKGSDGPAEKTPADLPVLWYNIECAGLPSVSITPSGASVQLTPTTSISHNYSLGQTIVRDRKGACLTLNCDGSSSFEERRTHGHAEPLGGASCLYGFNFVNGSLDCTDSVGNHFTVSAEGNVSVDVSPDHEDLSLTTTNPPQLFVLRPDGSSFRFLREKDTAEDVSDAQISSETRLASWPVAGDVGSTLSTIVRKLPKKNAFREAYRRPHILPESLARTQTEEADHDTGPNAVVVRQFAKHPPLNRERRVKLAKALRNYQQHERDTEPPALLPKTSLDGENDMLVRAYLDAVAHMDDAEAKSELERVENLEAHPAAAEKENQGVSRQRQETSQYRKQLDTDKSELQRQLQERDIPDYFHSPEAPDLVAVFKAQQQALDELSKPLSAASGSHRAIRNGSESNSVAQEDDQIERRRDAKTATQPSVRKSSVASSAGAPRNSIASTDHDSRREQVLNDSLDDAQSLVQQSMVDREGAVQDMPQPLKKPPSLQPASTDKGGAKSGASSRSTSARARSPLLRSAQSRRPASAEPLNRASVLPPISQPNNDSSDAKSVVAIKPEKLDFGVVQEGGVYEIRARVFNYCKSTARYSIRLLEQRPDLAVTYQHGPVAAGLDVPFAVTLKASLGEGAVGGVRHIVASVVVLSDKATVEVPVKATVMSAEAIESERRRNLGKLHVTSEKRATKLN